MHAFARLRRDVDLFRIWCVAMGVTVIATIMNVAYREPITGWMLLRGVPETALALIAADGRKWARVMLGILLALSAMGAGLLLAAGSPDVVHEMVNLTYAIGTALAAARAFRWI